MSGTGVDFAGPTAVERLAEWIVAVQPEHIPDPVRDKARAQLMSVIAACHAGSDTDAGCAAQRAVSAWNKPGPCTVIPTGEQMALHEAVTVNAAFSMALDYDDYLYMGHTGHSVVLASLALCEQESLSAGEMLVAQVIANEIGGRIGASIVLGPQNGQAWSFIHAAAGAAVASRLLGLTAEQTAHALAIALYQPTFTLWPGFMGPTSKILTAAGPTVTGIQAAQMAREGLTGAREILEHPRKGFWKTFSFAPLPAMLGGLGKVWLTETLAVKAYPGCAYLDTTLDALFAVLEEAKARKDSPLSPNRVKRVVVEASLLTVEMDNLGAEHDAGGPISPVTVNFSVSLSVAVGLLAGRLTPAELTRGFLDEHERAIRDLAARVELRHDWAMTIEVVRAFGHPPGGKPVLRQLRLRDLRRVLSGYRSQMGGSKKNRVGPLGLLPALWRARSGLFRAPAAFRTAFPARVAIETTDGHTYEARRDVPHGAPGQEGYFETVEAKFLREVGVHLPADRTAHALDLIKEVENSAVPELVKAVCVGLG